MSWIIYDSTSLVLKSVHDSEPTTNPNESKADVGNHYFVPGQAVENFKYVDPDIVERTEQEIEESTFDPDYKSIIQSELGLINQTTGFEPFFIRESIPNVVNGVWSWQVPFDGDFLLMEAIRWSYNNTQTNFLVHTLRDGVEFDFPLHIEPKDSSGQGISLPTVANGQIGPNVNSGTDQFHLSGGQREMKGLVGGDTHTFELEFACQSVNQEATIYNALIGIFAVDNKNEQL